MFEWNLIFVKKVHPNSDVRSLSEMQMMQFQLGMATIMTVIIWGWSSLEEEDQADHHLSVAAGVPPAAGEEVAVVLPREDQITDVWFQVRHEVQSAEYTFSFLFWMWNESKSKIVVIGLPTICCVEQRERLNKTQTISVISRVLYQRFSSSVLPVGLVDRNKGLFARTGPVTVTVKV